MGFHTIYDFVEYCNDSHMDYLDNYTYHMLKKYVSEKVDTSDWCKCDVIQVHMTYDCSETPKIYIWDGDKLVYPFYNGKCNTIDSSFKNQIDDLISYSGYMPNIFQAFFDYDPFDVFYNDDFTMPSTIGFVNLNYWADDISCNINRSDYVSTSYGDSVITICNFDGNKHLVFIGEYDDNIMDYISCNNAYDFDISKLLLGYNVDLSEDDIYDICGGSSDDYYMFIHRYHMNVNYNIDDDSEDYISHSSSKFVCSTERSYSVKSIDKCCATTHTGARCSNNAQTGGLCGKHKRSRRRY